MWGSSSQLQSYFLQYNDNGCIVINMLWWKVKGVLPCHINILPVSGYCLDERLDSAGTCEFSSSSSARGRQQALALIGCEEAGVERLRLHVTDDTVDGGHGGHVWGLVRRAHAARGWTDFLIWCTQFLGWLWLWVWTAKEPPLITPYETENWGDWSPGLC